MPRIVLVTPPSPAFSVIDRQAAGGMGIWVECSRPTIGHSEFAQYDLGLLWTGGLLLEQGHQVEFIDGQAERLDAESLAQRVRAARPDFVVGMVQFVSLTSDLRLLRHVKQACGGPPLIAVGSATATVTDDVLADPTVDYIVVGEPEQTTAELIATLQRCGDVSRVPGVAWREAGTLRHSPPRGPTDLANLPVTPYHLLAPYPYHDAFYFRPDKIGLIATTRGCPFRCGYYCPYPAAYGRKIRFRRPETVIDEIRLLGREFGVRSFYFRDQVFTASEPHAREICRRITGAGLDIRWICETRFDLLRNDDLLDDMRRAGCVQIHFGLESGDPRLFASVGKPGCSLEMARDAVARVSRRGIRVHFHLILGLPGETWSTVRHTAAFLRDIGVTRTNLNRCTPYPGTELYRQAASNGWIQTHDWSCYGRQFVMRTAAMSTWELELAVKYLVLQCCGNRQISRLRKRDKLLRPALNLAVEQFL